MGEEVKTQDMPSKHHHHHFVLVHGISHGAWCWYKIQALLQKAGHKVSCLDLAGAGIDRSHADEIFTFDQYDKPLFDFISALPEDDKVILVGHSAGGLSVTRASHEFGNKIRLAIYIGATMLQSGFRSEKDFEDAECRELNDSIDIVKGSHEDTSPSRCRLEVWHVYWVPHDPDGPTTCNHHNFIKLHVRHRQGVPDLSDFGDVYELGFGLGSDKPPTSAIIRKEFQQRILYQLSPLEDSTLGSLLLRPGPLMALQSARFDGGDGIDKVDRIYIRTTRDHVVRPKQQDEMIKRWPPREIFTLESDHCPFFSNPEPLVELLIKASASTCPNQ